MLLLLALKYHPSDVFRRIAFPYCTSFTHGILFKIHIAQARANSGNDLKFPRDLLTTNFARVQRGARARKHKQSDWHVSDVTRLTFSRHFLFAELNRFHHLKDFTYNYEGEAVSSVTGASSARSGLRIRARCVVKTVGRCQHVLKVRQTSLYGLLENSDIE